MRAAATRDRHTRTPYGYRPRAKVPQMDIDVFRRMMVEALDETVFRCAVCAAPMDERRDVCRRCEG